MFEYENGMQVVMYAAYNAYYDNLITEAEYAEAVEDALTVLGENAHCNDTDPALYGTYSDCYKSDTGIRPRGYVTRKDVIEYLEYYSSPEKQAAMQAEWDAETEWLAEQERKLAEEEAAAIELANDRYEREMWELEQRA